MDRVGRRQQVEQVAEREELHLLAVARRDHEPPVAAQHAVELLQHAPRLREPPQQIADQDGVEHLAREAEIVRLSDLEAHALLDGLLLLAQTLAGLGDGLGIAVDAEHGLALAPEQDRGDAGAAADVEDTPAAGLAAGPVDTRAGMVLLPRRPRYPLIERGCRRFGHPCGP